MGSAPLVFEPPRSTSSSSQSFYAALGEGLTEIEIDPQTLRGRDTSRRTGRRYETESAWVWTVAEGRAAALKAYHDTAAMTGAMRPRTRPEVRG